MTYGCRCVCVHVCIICKLRIYADIHPKKDLSFDDDGHRFWQYKPSRSLESGENDLSSDIRLEFLNAVVARVMWPHWSANTCNAFLLPTSACMDAFVHAYMNVTDCILMSVCVYVYVHMCVCVCVYAHVCMYGWMFVLSLPLSSLPLAVFSSLLFNFNHILTVYQVYLPLFLSPSA